MGIVIEGFTVVVKKEAIRPLLKNKLITPPNSTSLQDDDLWRCGFMVKVDADRFLQLLEDFGLNISQEPEPDVVIVNEFTESIEPDCQWIEIRKWKKAVLAWKVGSDSRMIVAHKDWDPNVGSHLVFSEHEKNTNPKFLRLDGNLEVYLNKDTGKEVYIGRTSAMVDIQFELAAKIIEDNFVDIGQPPLEGEAAKEVQEAISMLTTVIDEAPDCWDAHWYHGEGMIALGIYEEAYKSLKRAYELEKTVEKVPRELGGVCLELGKYDEAVLVSEKNAVLSPNNPKVLGNLSLSYLMAEKIDAASITISAALELGEKDRTNRFLERIISEVSNGLRKQPRVLGDIIEDNIG